MIGALGPEFHPAQSDPCMAGFVFGDPEVINDTL